MKILGSNLDKFLEFEKSIIFIFVRRFSSIFLTEIVYNTIYRVTNYMEVQK